MVTYADDEEGFFDDDPGSAAEADLDDANADGQDEEPIGWIDGRPANEPPAPPPDFFEDDDGDVEMLDAEAARGEEGVPELITAQVVTDELVKEWSDPLSNYVIDATEKIGLTRGKRRNAVQQRFFCYYCKKGIDGEPFYCPHPDSTMQCPLPDLEYPFCHATCGKGWGTWEVGEPLSIKLCQVIDARAGYVAPVAPAPYELLVNQMGGLVVGDDFAHVVDEENGDKAVGDARRARHKDGKVDRE